MLLLESEDKMKPTSYRFQVCCSTCGLVDTYSKNTEAREHAKEHQLRDLSATIEVFDLLARHGQVDVVRWLPNAKMWCVMSRKEAA